MDINGSPMPLRTKDKSNSMPKKERRKLLKEKIDGLYQKLSETLLEQRRDSMVIKTTNLDF